MVYGAVKDSKIMSKLLIVLGVIVLLVFGVGAALVGSYNGLISKKQAVDAKWAEVQNQYQRRFDLVPNLVETVSGAANFEKSTLTEIAQARASVGQVKLDPSQAPTNAAKLKEYEAAQSSLGNALSRLLVVSENYPQLKTNQNFLELQAQLEGTENRISTARTRFNEAVQEYNTSIQTLPTVFFAGMLGFTPKPYFEGAAGSEVAPKVKFNTGGQQP